MYTSTAQYFNFKRLITKDSNFRTEHVTHNTRDSLTNPIHHDCLCALVPPLVLSATALNMANRRQQVMFGYGVRYGGTIAIAAVHRLINTPYTPYRTIVRTQHSVLYPYLHGYQTHALLYALRITHSDIYHMWYLSLHLTFVSCLVCVMYQLW